MIISLREYQQECVDAIITKKEKGITRPLVSMATGLGKTVVFSSLAKTLGQKTLILAHRGELLEQAKAKLKLVWPEAAIGIVKANVNEYDKQIVVASVQSASRKKHLAQLKEKGFDLCIIDEAHHSTAASYEKVVRELGFLDPTSDKLLLGVTATPKRGDGTGLDSIFQEIVFTRGIAWGIREGYLSELIGQRIGTKTSLKGVRTHAGDFATGELSDVINIDSRNQLIVETFKEYAGERKKAVAFCADVQHAKDLAKAFRAAGISATAVYGAMDADKRARTLKRFSKGKLQVITNCGVLTEGFDQPSIDTILLCRPTKSEVLYTQCVGRGTRPFPNKQNCLILDFVDASRQKLCDFQSTLEGVVTVQREKRYASLDAEGKEVPQYGALLCETTGTSEIEFFGRASKFNWMKIGPDFQIPLGGRADILVRQVEGDSYEALMRVNGGDENLRICKQLLPLSYAIGVAEDFLRAQEVEILSRKDAKWRQDPPSKKQIDALESFGIVDPTLSKGEAADILRVKFLEKQSKRKPHPPKAIPTQKKKLRRLAKSRT